MPPTSAPTPTDGSQESWFVTWDKNLINYPGPFIQWTVTELLLFWKLLGIAQFRGNAQFVLPSQYSFLREALGWAPGAKDYRVLEAMLQRAEGTRFETRWHKEVDLLATDEDAIEAYSDRHSCSPRYARERLEEINKHRSNSKRVFGPLVRCRRVLRRRLDPTRPFSAFLVIEFDGGFFEANYRRFDKKARPWVPIRPSEVGQLRARHLVWLSLLVSGWLDRPRTCLMRNAHRLAATIGLTDSNPSRRVKKLEEAVYKVASLHKWRLHFKLRANGVAVIRRLSAGTVTTLGRLEDYDHNMISLAEDWRTASKDERRELWSELKPSMRRELSEIWQIVNSQ